MELISMTTLKLMSPQRFTTLLLGCLALLLVLSIIIFPERAFQSSLQGLTIWWKLVFPALLPFLIITEIVRGMGFLHALGVLLEPLLRLVFRLPGIGGWAIALGFTAGAPSGAIAIGELRRGNMVTREEAERLMSLSHVANPIMLITVVGVGFLQNAKLGLVLALIHYGAAIVLGLFQRFTSKPDPSAPRINANRDTGLLGSPGLFYRSIAVLKSAQAADGRTFGKLLGDSVIVSVQHLMAIGGVIMMFSVLVQVITLTQVASYGAAALSSLGLASQSGTEALLMALLSGIFEMHLGAYAIGQSNLIPNVWLYAGLSALLAWGGLSAHAQVKSFIYNTDIRYSAFLRSRLIHAAISFFSTLMLWRSIYRWVSEGTSPVFLQSTNTGYVSKLADIHGIHLWPLLSPLMMWFGGLLLALLLLSVFTAFIWRHHGKNGHGS
jgi:sporulation integral membrane protein YlbJ